MWKDIVGYENVYQVSNYGNVRNIKKGNMLTPSPEKKGYLRVSLWKDGGYKTKKVHRLVCECFLDNLNNKSQVNHIDGIKTNNNVNNLEWVTNDENVKHKVKLDLTHKPRGTKNGRCTISENTARSILTDVKDGKSILDITIKYKVSRNIVTNIKYKKAWKHIQEE